MKNRKMSKITVIILVIFGGLVVFNVVKSMVVGYFLRRYQPPAISVSSVHAQKTTWTPVLSSVGDFVAVNGVEINSELAGKVTKIHFKSSQFVNKNEPLVDIDDSVDQATLKYNQADMVLQQLNYNRQIELLKHNAASKSAVDEAKAHLLQSIANVENTQALIAQKHIKAPFAGKLGIRQISLGQYLEPVQTSIVPLQSMDPIYLTFYLPEQYLHELAIDQDIHFSVEQNPNIQFMAKINAIDSKIDTNTHNVQIRALVSNCPSLDGSIKTAQYLKNHTLKSNSDETLVSCNTALNKKNKVTNFNFIPGMFASIRVLKPNVPNVVVLPTTAISYSMFGNSIFVINGSPSPKDKEKPEYTVKRKFVTLGETRGNYTEIKKGLKEGQLVVATGEFKLTDGSKVIINNSVQLNDHVNIDTLGE